MLAGGLILTSPSGEIYLYWNQHRLAVVAANLDSSDTLIMKTNTEILEDTLKELVGRLADIDAERKEVVRQIDGLKRLIGKPVKKKAGRRKFTNAQKKAQGERMKEFWADKKKATQKTIKLRCSPKFGQVAKV